MGRLGTVLTGVALVALGATSAFAQAAPAVGVRAAGMGGAFVGVADDASAVYWNPAGLASGAFFGLVLDRNVLRPDEKSGVDEDGSAFLVAIGTPPLGVTYYRQHAFVAPTAAIGIPVANAEVDVQHAGLTVLHSVTSGLAVGATLKAVHLDSGINQKTHADADLGLMASGALGKVGVVVRNLTEPTVNVVEGEARLQRQVRGGASILVRQEVRVAFDADFTKAATPLGEWRDAALGAEARVLARTWVRGGIHWNTAGDDGLGAAPVESIGGSTIVYRSLMADAQVSFGAEKGRRGWGIGLRFNF